MALVVEPERFYDPKTNRVINLPDNYLGVAARIASISYELGISNDRAFLDKLLDRAAVQFTEAIFTPTMRRRRDVTIVTQTSTRATSGKRRRSPGVRIFSISAAIVAGQMRLWWDVVSEDGYGYNWGRSRGVVSYLDTPEIAGFLASHPEFRPAPLADLAALYYQAWNYLLHDYRSDAHLLSIFAFGRGNSTLTSRASVSGNRRRASSASLQTRTRR